jgi:hypothetical protein
MRGMLATVRVALLVAGCTTLAAAVWWLAAPPLSSLLTALRGGGVIAVPLETVLLGLCAAALLGCVAWLVLATSLTLLAYAARSAAPRSRRAAALGRTLERRCPRVTRRLVTATLGLALTTGLAGTALADPPSRTGLAGLTLPDRTTGEALSTAVPRTVALRDGGAPGHDLHARRVVVRPGDSLWRIAARLLHESGPDQVTDADVTDAWHLLRDANRRRVGPDPDLIRPGASLEVPRQLIPHRKDAP